jgi:hypothetical protein
MLEKEVVLKFDTCQLLTRKISSTFNRYSTHIKKNYHWYIVVSVQNFALEDLHTDIQEKAHASLHTQAQMGKQK